MKTFILILVLHLLTPAQTLSPKVYLGAAEPTPIKRTAYEFNYNSNGFDRLRAKKIKKSAEYLGRKGVIPYTVNDFVIYTNQAGQSDFIPKAIDTAYDTIKSKWLACGTNSKSARTVREFDPRTVTIIVEQGSFWITPNNIYANGAVMNKNTIRAVIVSMNGMRNSKTASLVRFDALMLWEIGNLLAMRADYKITSVDQEIGDSSPCSKIH